MPDCARGDVGIGSKASEEKEVDFLQNFFNLKGRRHQFYATPTLLEAFHPGMDVDADGFHAECKSVVCCFL